MRWLRNRRWQKLVKLRESRELDNPGNRNSVRGPGYTRNLLQEEAQRRMLRYGGRTDRMLVPRVQLVLMYELLNCEKRSAADDQISGLIAGQCN